MLHIIRTATYIAYTAPHCQQHGLQRARSGTRDILWSVILYSRAGSIVSAFFPYSLFLMWALISLALCSRLSDSCRMGKGQTNRAKR